MTVFVAMGLLISKQPHAHVLLLGLDNAGKSTMLYKLKHNANVNTVPTIGFNVDTMEAKKNRKSIVVNVWDVGGQQKMRSQWGSFHQEAAAVVFIVDSSDKKRLEEAQQVLKTTLEEEIFRSSPLLLLANKQDKDGALTATELEEKFNMKKTCSGRDWFVMPCSASTGIGVQEAFTKVVQMVKLPTEPGAMKENIKDTVHYLKTNRKH